MVNDIGYFISLMSHNFAGFNLMTDAELKFFLYMYII